MKGLLIVLILLLLSLQFRLWFGDGGRVEIKRLQQAIEAQQIQNQALRERNAALEADVMDLKQGVAAIEERARSELGMVKEGETFYQTVDEDASH